MARTFSQALTDALATKRAPSILLLDLTVAGTTHYWAEQKITFGGNAYTAHLRLEDAIRQRLALELDSAQATIINVDRTVRDLIAGAQIQGGTGVLRRFYPTANEAMVVFDGVIADADVGEEVGQIRLAANLDPAARRLPIRGHALLCTWRFKSAECGFVGALTTCTKTFAQCTERAQTHRFNGFLQLDQDLQESVPKPVEPPEDVTGGVYEDPWAHMFPAES